MKLDAVDWQSLEHAYGEASDLPALFTQVAAGKAASVDKLANLLAHQGWLAPEVSLASIPFLGDLAQTTSGKTRAALLRLLADLACAGDHCHFLGTGITPDNPVFELVSESTVHAVREAVVTLRGGMIAALHDSSAPVRSAAALLACSRPSAPHRSLPVPGRMAILPCTRPKSCGMPRLGPTSHSGYTKPLVESRRSCGRSWGLVWSSRPSLGRLPHLGLNARRLVLQRQPSLQPSIP